MIDEMYDFYINGRDEVDGRTLKYSPKLIPLNSNLGL